MTEAVSPDVATQIDKVCIGRVPPTGTYLGFGVKESNER